MDKQMQIWVQDELKKLEVEIKHLEGVVEVIIEDQLQQKKMNIQSLQVVNENQQNVSRITAMLKEHIEKLEGMNNEG